MSFFGKKKKAEDEEFEDDEPEVVQPKSPSLRKPAASAKTSGKSAKPAADPGYTPSAMSARVWGGRAELRYHNLTLKVIIFGLLAALFATNYSWHRVLESALQKQFVVFHDKGQAGTTVGESSQFQTGPSDDEIKYRAFDTIRWIVGASSKNIDTAYGEAKRYMTADFKDLFDQAMEQRKNEIRGLGIYTTLDNVAVRQLKPQDLVGVKEESKEPIGKYDMLVTGTVNFFREGGTGDRERSVPFAYHVKMVQAEKRTLDNPSAVLVKRIAEVPVAASGPSAEEKAAAAQRAEQERLEQEDMDRRMGRKKTP